MCRASIFRTISSDGSKALAKPKEEGRRICVEIMQEVSGIHGDIRRSRDGVQARSSSSAKWSTLSASSVTRRPASRRTMRIVSGTQIVISLVGSVALLLWGVRMVRTGMTRNFGPALRRLLGDYGTSRIGALGAGLVTTTILQSSTATALLLASFASRGLIELPIALAAMLGADIGTSVAAQIFSLDVKWIWTVLVGAGVVIFMSSGNDKTRGLGRIVLGLGTDAACADAYRNCGRAVARFGDLPLASVRARRRADAGVPGDHPDHLVRPFQPVDRAADHVACGDRRASGSAYARTRSRRQCRRRDCPSCRAVRVAGRRAARCTRQSRDANRARHTGPVCRRTRGRIVLAC